MRILGLLRSGVVVSIADRPDRLVGDADAAQGVALHIRQSQPELAVEQRFCLVRFTLFQGLPDAQDDIESGSQGDLYLLVDERVGLARVCAGVRCVPG